MKYHDLPEAPTRPHTYYGLESFRVPVNLPGRQDPVSVYGRLAGSGPPLLLIHGLMTSGYSFRYVVPALAAKYRVIIPDLPGAGRSEAPADLSLSPRSIANVIDGLIRSLGIEPPFVVGNSLGGYQALWFTTLFPDQARKLIVIHAPGFPQLPVSALRALLSWPIGRDLYRKLIWRDPEDFVVQNIHYYDKAIMSREEAGEYAVIFRDRARTDTFLRLFRESFDPISMRELAKTLSTARDTGGAPQVPTRLFWARQDKLVPASFGQRYQKLIPSAEIVWFDHAGHFVQVDRPEQTVREIFRFDS